MERLKLLEEILMQLPAFISIVRGEDYRFEMINPPAQEFIGNKDVIGKTVRESFPELESQGFIEILDNVRLTRKPYVNKAMPATIYKGGEPVHLYVDVTYLPFISTSGEVVGIISFSYDVTDAVLAKKRAEETSEHLKQAYEDLEVKVRFRNMQLEKEKLELQKKIDTLLSESNK